MVTGGDAATMGIGIITAARETATYDFLVHDGLLDPAKLNVQTAYDASFVNGIKVLP